MKPALFALSALALASAADAQSTRTGTAYGSTWGWYYLEIGAERLTVLTGRPSLMEMDPEAVITIMTRDGRPLTETDRPEAIGVARALCEQGGRHFNTQTRGHWLNNGGLSFNGACTLW